MKARVYQFEGLWYDDNCRNDLVLEQMKILEEKRP